LRPFSKPAWPIAWLLIGYPLWWALGLGDFIWMILAIPMAARMIGWRARGSRQLRVPPMFGLWLLFLVCVFVGAAALGTSAPGTAPSPVSHRVFSFADRASTYIGLTVLLLYVGNLTEQELPRRRLAWMLGLLAIYTVGGGLAAMVKPTFQFASPLDLLLPHSLRGNYNIQAVTHPGLAQMQDVLGGANARPKAPFDYTNTWGSCLTLLLPWLVVGWWHRGSRRQRLIAGIVLPVSIVPLLYSLNRTAWVGAVLSLAFVLLWLVAKRPRTLIRTALIGVVVVGIVAVATPVPRILSGRLAHPGSAGLRASLDALAVRDGLSSPVIGYGDTRKQLGSHGSIARGPSAKCALCGEREVGSTGQLWALLVSDGVLGAVLYVGFFVAGIWRFRRDRTAYGRAGLLCLVLPLLYLFSYSALPAPLGITMLAFGLLWRNQLEGQRQAVRQPVHVWQPRLPETFARDPEPVA
jgi:hypothetical protein